VAVVNGYVISLQSTSNQVQHAYNVSAAAAAAAAAHTMQKQLQSVTVLA
jgi:hypothetical protein